ncbi:hypothetical protein HanRHA438_Chr13g0579581 [Helianthus annuus]|nr:hypothetical protein HanRHA438_Chr13g0579581 [Helianthus annuus]
MYLASILSNSSPPLHNLQKGKTYHTIVSTMPSKKKKKELSTRMVPMVYKNFGFSL